MTQGELADRSGVSRSYIAQVERGDITNIGIEPLTALAKALGVTVGYLIGETEDVPGDDELDAVSEGRAVYVVRDMEEHRLVQELFTLFQGLKPADQRLALSFLRRMAGEARVIGDE